VPRLGPIRIEVADALLLDLLGSMSAAESG